jgi:small subunit ribosomal protein S1
MSHSDNPDDKSGPAPPPPATDAKREPALTLPAEAKREPALTPPAPAIPRLDKDALDREVEAAMGGLSDQDIYGELSAGGRKPAPTGEAGRKKGKVLQVRGNDVFVEVPGGRSEGVLPIVQFPEGPPAIGSEVEIHIEGYDSANGLLRLTRLGAAVHADWSSVAVGMTVEARVTGTNKGGLSVEVNSIRGFMPISQIDLYRVENADQFVNQRLLCLVTDVDKEHQNLVVSRRALLEREREESRDKLWQELAEGQVRDGIVRSVKDFGAFIDLGGVDGLLHISEMSWARVADAAAIVKPGQTVKVQVLKIDREKRKVSLGMKQLLPSPWDSAHDRFAAGHVVSGKVTRLMDFGAFVELEPGVEGLIHISELAPQRIRRVADVVQPGQEVQVKVLSVDPNQRRISLSLKAAQPDAGESEASEEEAEEFVEEKPRHRTTPLRGGIGDE